MVNTTLRDIPQDWYEQVKLLAKLERRSINSQLVHLIGYGLNDYEERGEFQRERDELRRKLREDAK